MAKSDNLIDFLKDIADAIREKKGTSDPINAQDFADEIKNGGNSGGGTASTMEYWDVSNIASTAKNTICKRSVYVKGTSENGLSGAGMTYADFDGITNEKPYTHITAVAIDLSAKIVAGMGDMIQTVSYKEYLINNGVSESELAAIPRITEEEFYNLNVEE